MPSKTLPAALVIIQLLALAKPASAQDLRFMPASAALPSGPTATAAPQTAAPLAVSTAPAASLALRPGAMLSLDAGQGRIVSLQGSAASVFAADPKVAEVRPASPTSLFIFGVAPGRTTVAALDAAGRPIAQYEVMVRPSAYSAVAAQTVIARALPDTDIRIETTPGGLIASGEVATPADADRVMSVVRSHMPEGQRAENRLNVRSQMQVNLRVRVAEVSRQVTRQFGINWQAFGPTLGVGSFGQIARLAVSLASRNTLADPTNQPSALGLGVKQGDISASALIDLLAQDGLITVLAEPNLTSLSGETASFLVGGEFPVPVGRRDGFLSIEFKQFGISLAFVPIVLGDGRIHLRVKPEVSELTTNGAITLSVQNSTLQIPALAVRRAETTIELGSGESFAMAGLLQDNNRMIGRALPGIGEVPVLGALFRSDNYQRNETELVIVVTPYIVRPHANPTAIRTPLDDFVPPSDRDRILYFRQRASAPGASSRLPGDAGFILN